MRIGNRNFPYPVLNANSDLSGYQPNCLFRHAFDVGGEGSPVITNDALILKNARYVLIGTYLKQLCEKQLLKGVFIVDCSSGCYRRSFEVTDVPRDIIIPISRLNGTVSVSCFLYAAEDIDNFAPTQLLPEYDGMSFYIEKFDIVAVDDGVDFNIEINESLDNRTASIFTIVKKDTLDGLIKYERKTRNIVIQLPEEQYACYDNMKMWSAYNNIAFSMIAIPVLAACLSDVASEIRTDTFEDFEEALDSYPWLKSVQQGYKRVTGVELDWDILDNAPAFELAQLVLNSASCKGLSAFNDILIGNHQDIEAEDGTEDGND